MADLAEAEALLILAVLEAQVPADKGVPAEIITQAQITERVEEVEQEQSVGMELLLLVEQEVLELLTPFRVRL